MFKKIDSEELSLKVYRMIISMLEDGELDDYERLPSEMELAEKIGVSRSVVRDAMSILESEGFITRKRGIGTVINKEVVKAGSRLDLESNFMAMVEREGYKASCKLLGHGIIEEDGKKYLQIERLIYADDKPAIYIDDSIPYEYVNRKVTKKEVDLPSTYRFLFDNNIPLPETVLLDIKPRVGDALAMEMLEIGKNDPYMEVMERGFDIHQNLVLRSKTLFRDQVFNFTIVRKRINWAKVFS